MDLCRHVQVSTLKIQGIEIRERQEREIAGIHTRRTGNDKTGKTAPHHRDEYPVDAGSTVIGADVLHRRRHGGQSRSAAVGIHRPGGVYHVALWRTARCRLHGFLGPGGPLLRGGQLRAGTPCVAAGHCVLMLTAVAIHSRLPFWLGGGADIAADASMYFLIFSLALPMLQMSSLAGSMLKCSGNMRIPSMLNIMMCALDVAFNYIFIFVIGLGVAGAAVGTLMAITVTACMMMYFMIFRPGELSLKGRPGSFRPTADCVKAAFKIGAPMSLQQILMGSAQIVSTAIVAPLGNISIAANTFAITVESICYMPGYGIAEAATTLVGQGLGAGRRMLTRSFARLSVALGMTVMTLMAVLMFVFAPEMMAIMTPVEDIRALGTGALRIEAFAEPMFAAAIVCYGVFVGAGDTLKPAIMNLASMWAVRLSAAAILAPHYGLRGVWVAMATELIFRGAIFLIRLFKGGWMETTKKEEPLKKGNAPD